MKSLTQTLSLALICTHFTSAASSRETNMVLLSPRAQEPYMSQLGAALEARVIAQTPNMKMAAPQRSWAAGSDREAEITGREPGGREPAARARQTPVNELLWEPRCVSPVIVLVL